MNSDFTDNNFQISCWMYLKKSNFFSSSMYTLWFLDLFILSVIASNCFSLSSILLIAFLPSFLYYLCSKIIVALLSFLLILMDLASILRINISFILWILLLGFLFHSCKGILIKFNRSELGWKPLHLACIWWYTLKCRPLLQRLWLHTSEIRKWS